MGPETPPCDRKRKTNFQSLIGCLNNLALSSRPGICLHANTLGSFVETPGEAHWQTVKRVLGYLSGTTLTFRDSIQVK